MLLMDNITLFSSFLTETQSKIFSDSSHFGHFTVTMLLSIVTSTQLGILMGFFQIFDILNCL
ncbi:MAG: hypothetical protein BWY04_00659 [candidate division CPR1 bacterium ADurb.Bin160]|uniref:Uncharacterized protein n=1 Tax=candidate division CPR1 bacterium ADurb.Bin160 TaxID=1852826 RepID=A0A1V5ZNG8_9BACT|nr:MAG: hypothetical protein BWY04_00659 [candidate division CPR1 bacterium ADurb.Bin160]